MMSEVGNLYALSLSRMRNKSYLCVIYFRSPLISTSSESSMDSALSGFVSPIALICSIFFRVLSPEHDTKNKVMYTKIHQKTCFFITNHLKSSTKL